MALFSRIALAALCLAGPASAQQILTATFSERNPSNATDRAVSTVAGAKVETGSASQPSRAQSDYGVNKVIASSTGGFDHYATSAWLDTYAVSSTVAGPVNVAMSFTFDGTATLPVGSSGYYNFKLYALRGNNFTLSGRAPQSFNTKFDFKQTGTQYDSLLLSSTNPSGFTQSDLREYDGVYNYNNVSGVPGAFRSRVNYIESGDYYETETTTGVNRFYADRLESRTGTNPVNIVPYNLSPQALATRRALEANFIVVDTAFLCDGPGRGCTTNFSGSTTLSLNFNVAAGSSFTIASWLYADDLDNGSIDFFNTARLGAITLSPGASLTSGSGVLESLPGGGFGYPQAPVGGVPEPASWAMLIIGFGMAGAAQRRSRRRIAA